MNIESILYSLPGILIGLTVHEYCHALAAYKLGDTTARDMGRLTLSPLKHIDPIGFLFIIIAGFGWAKPVRFNPDNLANYRRDKAIIAAAGPLSNLVLALVFIALLRGWLALNGAPYPFIYSDLFSGFIIIILRAAVINLGLFIFNLLPLPPLDGSHIVFSGLNLGQDLELKIMKVGAPALFLIIIIQNNTGLTLLPIGSFILAVFRLLLPQLSW